MVDVCVCGYCILVWMDGWMEESKGGRKKRFKVEDVTPVEE